MSLSVEDYTRAYIFVGIRRCIHMAALKTVEEMPEQLVKRFVSIPVLRFEALDDTIVAAVLATIHCDNARDHTPAIERAIYGLPPRN